MILSVTSTAVRDAGRAVFARGRVAIALAVMLAGLAFTAGAQAQIQLAQHLANTTVATGYGFQIPISQATHQNDRLILDISAPGRNILSVADTQGNTWTRDSTYTAENFVYSALETKPLTTSDHITVRVSLNTNASYTLDEYSGIDPANPIDATSHGISGSGTAGQAQVTTTHARDLLVSSLRLTSPAGVTAPPEDTLVPTGAPLSQAVNLDAPVGTYPSRWTWTGSQYWDVEEIAYRAAPDGLYVATTGDDTNPCTIELPCQTIQHAIGLVGNGSTVWVEPGVYHEAASLSGHSNTTLAGYGGRPILDGDNTREYGVNLNNTSGDTVKGLEIRNTTSGVSPAWGIIGNTLAVNDTITDNVVHAIHGTGSYADGIELGTNSTPGSSHDDTISNNTVYDVGPGGESFGIWLLYTKHMTVTGNTIYAVRKEGIRDWVGFENTFTSNHLFLNWQGLNLESSDGDYVANNYSYNNVWCLNAKHNDESAATGTWGVAEWSKFWHNTCWDNTQADMGFGMNAPIQDEIDFEDNLLAGTGDANLNDFTSSRTANVIVDGNAYQIASNGIIYYNGWATQTNVQHTLTDLQTNIGWDLHGQTFTPTFANPATGDLDLTNRSSLAPGVTLPDSYGAQVGADGNGPASIGYVRYPATVLKAPAPSCTCWGIQRVSNHSDNSYFQSAPGVTSGSFVLDLGSVLPANVVVMDVYAQNDNRIPKDVSIDVSPDNVNWTTVLTATNHDDEGSSFKYLLPAGTQARYVRLNYTDTFGGTYTVVPDIQVGQIG